LNRMVVPVIKQPVAGITYPKPSGNFHESRTLAALRDALLPKLLSDELRVPVAAKLVEAHA
jgi:hypothetical protein